MLSEVTDPDSQEEIGLLLHDGGKAEHTRSTVDPIGLFLVLGCPVVKVSGKLQHPSAGSMTDAAKPSGMKERVTLPGKEPRPAEGLVKAKEHIMGRRRRF